MWDTLWIEGRLATMADQAGQPYGALEDGAIAVQDGRIAWLGSKADLPGPPASLAKRVHRLEGRWLTPGLIDCHTHLVYGGDRAREFERRLEGASYEEIARAGGGIVSTVQATRASDEDTLMASSQKRLKALMAEGVTTVEIKSGYGLNLETEMKQLRVARALGESLPVSVKTTFLGAHALPPEFKDRADDYIAAVVAMLPEVARTGLADAVDAFCEKIAFSAEQTAQVFEAARALGLPVKLHADQLSDLGGAALAARFGALSADHLEYTSESGIAAMAQSGTVAVLLPGAFYALRETKLPPVEGLRRAKVPIAIASDCNPGSAPVTSLLLMINMACTLFRMTREESQQGFTSHGASAVRLGRRNRTLSTGKHPESAVWDIDRPAELAYRIGFNPLAYAVRAGEIRYLS